MMSAQKVSGRSDRPAKIWQDEGLSYRFMFCIMIKLFKLVHLVVLVKSQASCSKLGMTIRVLAHKSFH